MFSSVTKVKQLNPDRGKAPQSKEKNIKCLFTEHRNLDTCKESPDWFFQEVFRKRAFSSSPRLVWDI